MYVSAAAVGKEKTLEHLVPLFSRLLKDDFPDVRLTVISKLDSLQAVIGVGRWRMTADDRPLYVPPP